MQNLPSDIQSYLNEIAERLWTGHASVMVGAGFSKNAGNTINSAKQPPNWWQLGDAFYEKLHNKKPDSDVKYVSLLKLAEEYEAAFGRSALEHFIVKNIADNEYEPSKLHKMLMELPWTDVFTTNYDTLLERTCKDVLSRRYDIVVNQNDLIYSNKPRIIKLHGSLPSERPFIVTEEDYRIYPKKYAPFVNTVQQSLLENTLCLIGFSGDDPNFLQWIGWINDNIGRSNASKIYLIGVLNLSESQKKLLNQKNIIPVDLSGYSEVNGDHKKGLEIFINYLACQKLKRENLDWPLRSDLKTLKSLREEVNFKPVIEEWRKCREKYSNWIILPQEQREKLWMYTESHSSNISAFEHLQMFEDLDYIYELNWRLEKCLFPIWNEMVPYCQKILNRYNLFPKEIAEKREINIESWSGDGINWEQYKKYWIQLSLALLRFYREENFDNEWILTQNTIQSIKQHLSADQLSRFYYEQILNAIFKMKHKEAKKILDEWPQNNIPVFWNAKRAMLLAEFGQGKEAANLLESSLLDIRRKLNLSPIEDDYTWVSLEAYVMLQLKMVQYNIRWGPQVNEEGAKDKTDGFNERWNDLLQFKCDPWGEQKYFDLMLQQPYIPKNSLSVKNEFEIGRNTRSFTLGGTSKDFIVAYTFLRYLEELAVPLSLSSINFDNKTINGVLERIRFVSPQWGIAILNRSKDEKVVDIIFDREQLLRFSITAIDAYINEYIKLFYELLPERKSNPIAKAFTNKVPYILSRLCAKCSDALKIEMFKIYQYMLKEELALPKSEKLLRNLIDTSSKEILIEAVRFLLDSPVLNPERAISYTLNEPFDFLDSHHIKGILKLEKELFETLIDKAKESDGIRVNAIKRLMFLYNTQQLNKVQSEKMFDIIWGQVDAKDGFPKDTTFYHFAFINWPLPKGINAEALYKKYISENDFNVQGLRTKEGISMSGGDDRYTEELLYGSQTINKPDGVIWSLKELENILVKCDAWWEMDKQYVIDEKYKIERFAGSIYEEFLERFKNLTNVVARVLGYRRTDLSIEIIKRIETLTSYIASTAVPVLKIKVVFGFYKDYENYFTELKRAMTSKDRRVIIDALESIILAVHNSPYQNDAAFIAYLLDILTIPLQWKITELLGDVFSVVRDFTKHNDLDLACIEEHLYQSLQYVLDMNLEDIEMSEYLILKRNAISLAGTIYNKCAEKGAPIHQIILNWKAVSENEEEFGDIRNRW